MAASKSHANNLQGFPALFFLEALHDNRGEKKHVERMWSLESRYAYLLAYLPAKYDKNTKDKEFYDNEVLPDLVTIKDEIDAMFQAYNGLYEGASCTQEEKKFLTIMRGVMERLYKLAAKTNMIDNMIADSPDVIFS